MVEADRLAGQVNALGAGRVRERQGGNLLGSLVAVAGTGLIRAPQADSASTEQQCTNGIQTIGKHFDLLLLKLIFPMLHRSIPPKPKPDISRQKEQLGPTLEFTLSWL